MLTGEYIKNDRITEISEAVRLHNIREEKFNTNFISVLWIIPCERENATMISLLAEALRLGPAGDIKKLDERLAEMYGAVFETAVIKKGGRELLTLNMEVIKDENAGEKVFKNAASLMREIIGGRIGDKAFRQAKGRLAQILAERKRLRYPPCFPKFHSNLVLRSVCVTDIRQKNYAGHQNACLAFARMPFAFTHLQRNHFFLQQGGKQKLCHELVFHHILKNHIIDRVGYNCHRLVSPFVSVTGLSQGY